jgi:NAD(P)-dependent dehydrogenase (short-subunit alcohol dehydrogenase family)
MTLDPNHGKVAIIAGASRRIGAGLVEAFRKLGYRVIGNLRTNTDLDHPDVGMVSGDIADAFRSRRPRQLRGHAHQNRIGAVADIIHGALYLEAAMFVTGEILHIDGGQSAGH